MIQYFTNTYSSTQDRLRRIKKEKVVKKPKKEKPKSAAAIKVLAIVMGSNM